MSFVDEILNEVRSKIEPTTAPLDEARHRLALVRHAADSFPGALRTYRSGSLAVHTMNNPVTDGDGGLVLNRNNYTSLGPEGTGESPGEVVKLLCDHLRPIIRAEYPNAEIHKSKRGPKILFKSPTGDEDEDPTVDLVVALNRKAGSGLWIPNLDDDSWEASDPEKHRDFLNSGTPSFRSIRRKVIRLAKAWNKQSSSPGVSSFHLSVWAYEFLESGTGMANGLHVLFDEAASRLESGAATPDPAGVSPDLKLLNGVTAKVMGARLRKAANSMGLALAADTEAEARDAISDLFPNYLGVRSLLASGAAVPATQLGVPLVSLTTAGARAYGGSSRRSSCWHPLPWSAKPANQVLFMHQLEGLEGLQFADVEGFRDGFGVSFWITPVDCPRRKVTVNFRGKTPTVFVDGPTASPHRYHDGSLCMWFPDDPESQRWSIADGAAALVANIAAHLIREEYWRKDGVWHGPEAPHDVDQSSLASKAGVEFARPELVGAQ